MANIVNLFRDPHRNAQELLPWYVTDRLDADERAAVEEHLGTCATCREDLEAELRLVTSVSRMPLAADPGWTELRRKLSAGPRTPVIRQHRPWPPRLGWLLAGQAAIVALAVVALLPRSRPAPERAAPYRTLGSATTASEGNAIIIFRPDTSEAALRETLVGADSRLVDGPTASGVYVLRIAPSARDARLAQLRRQRTVLLAQPIDPQPLSGAGQ